MLHRGTGSRHACLLFFYLILFLGPFVPHFRPLISTRARSRVGTWEWHRPCVCLLCPQKCPVCSLLAQGAKVVVKHDIIMLLTSWAFCDPGYGSALERGLVLDEQDMGQTKVQIQSAFTERLLCARKFARPIPCVVFCNTHNKTLRQESLWPLS